MEPSDLMDQVEEQREKKSRLGAMVAVTVALLATFMGICNVKDNNICQAMQQAQADKIDDWGWYQAKKTRIEILKQSELHLTLSGLTTPEVQARQIALKKEIAEKQGELDETQAKAKKDETDYDALNFRDDQFDLADSSLSIAIALLAVTALTDKRWLYFLALVPTLFGAIMGIAGLMQLKIHPDFLARLLGA